MRSHRLVAVGAGLLAGATAVLFAPAPAAAAAPLPPTHCWVDLSSGRSACFASEAEVFAAIGAGSTGRTGLSGAARAETLASVALGTVYADADYLGSSYTFTAAGDCDTLADVDWQVSVMPTGWNDRVSSFRSYGLCQTIIWENTFSGASLGPSGNVSYVGSMNDRTSSIQWV
jgi:hypothetical protein